MNKYMWSPGDITWLDDEPEVTKATDGHEPPRFGKPRRHGGQFKPGKGKPGRHGAFSPGESGFTPLSLDRDTGTDETDADQVDQIAAPGEDGHETEPSRERADRRPGQPKPEGAGSSFGGTVSEHRRAATLPKTQRPTGTVTRDFPGWRFDRDLSALYAQRLASIVPAGLPIDLADAWQNANKAEQGGQPPPPQGGDPQPWLDQVLAQWQSSLQETLFDLWREGFFVGWQSGQSLTAGTATPDWGAWTPGHPEAAMLIQGEDDLDYWLGHYGIPTIRSIVSNRMEQLAQTLHTSLDEGWSADRLAKEIRSILEAPSRARMIAVTETARAVSQGTLAAYRMAGVDRVLWVTSEDARVCPPCDANEAMGAIPMGSAFVTGHDAPPAHPHCRCAVVAVPDGVEVPVRESSVSKCLTCGCDMPHNGHGDPRHITIEDLRDAAEATGISVQDAYHNFVHTVPHEWDHDDQGPAPEVVKVGPKGYEHGWVKVGADYRPGGKLSVERSGSPTNEMVQAKRSYMLNKVYENLNGQLREGRIPAGSVTTFVKGRQADHDLGAVASGLDAAIGQGSLSHDAILHRGLVIPAGEHDPFTPGATITHHGYVSTSGDRAVASNYAGGLFGTEGGSARHLVIHAPKGTPAMVGDTKQDEVILGRKTRMRVLSNDGNEVHVEVVP